MIYTLQDQEPLDIVVPEEKEQEGAQQERQCQESEEAQQKGQVQDGQEEKSQKGKETARMDMQVLIS